MQNNIIEEKQLVVGRVNPHQLNQLDNARGGLEVPDVEPDLQRLRVGAGVGGHCDLGMTGRFAPSIDVTHHLVTAVTATGD